MGMGRSGNGPKREWTLPRGRQPSYPMPVGRGDLGGPTVHSPLWPAGRRQVCFRCEPQPLVGAARATPRPLRCSDVCLFACSFLAMAAADQILSGRYPKAALAHVAPSEYDGAGASRRRCGRVPAQMWARPGADVGEETRQTWLQFSCRSSPRAARRRWRRRRPCRGRVRSRQASTSLRSRAGMAGAPIRPPTSASGLGTTGRAGPVLSFVVGVSVCLLVGCEMAAPISGGCNG